MKFKLFALSLLVLVGCGTGRHAQYNKIPQRLELVSIEVGTDVDDEISLSNEILEVFNMPSDGENHYFLSVGHLGFGDEVIQILFDPLFELFIPLGDNVTEALESLEKLQALFDADPGTSMQTTGCLAVGVPNDKREPVKVTYRTLLISRMLEFSVEREGYIRAAHLHRSDFNSLVNGVKFYKRLHPRE